MALVDGERYGVDRPNSLAVGEGIAILIAPGGVSFSSTTRESAKSSATCSDVGPRPGEER